MTLIDVDFLILIGNEYMFYLVAATLTSGMGSIPKPSVVTRLQAAVGIGTGDVGKYKRSVAEATNEGALFMGLLRLISRENGPTRLDLVQ